MKYFRQLDETDCGAACLAMVASYYKKTVPITYIREVAGTTTDGTSLWGLLEASHILGFNAKALRGSSGSIKKNAPCPFIAHTIYKTGNESGRTHFVVVKKVTSRYVYVYDPTPSIGKKYIPLHIFKEQWSGHAIFLSPSENFTFQKGTNYLFALLPLFKNQINIFITAAIASILLVACGVASSYYFRFLIDSILPSKSEYLLALISVIAILILCFQAIFGFIRNILLSHLGYRADTSLLFTFLEHILKLPLSFFDTRKSGEITSRFGDVLSIRNLISHSALSIFMDTIMLFIVGAILILTSPSLFFIAIVSLFINLIIGISFIKYFRLRYQKTMQGITRMQSFLAESINGMPTIKSLNAQNFILHQYQTYQMNVITESWEANKLSINQSLLTEIFQGIGSTVLFWVGAFLILKNKLTIGELIGFNSILFYFTGPVSRLIGIQPSIQEALVSAKRIGEILELQPERQVFNKKHFIIPDVFELCLNNISFHYQGRKQLFNNFNLCIRSGTSVGIIGPSGCGKTTFIKLLLKLYLPEKGEVLLNNQSFDDIDTNELRTQIGYVPQEIFLFSGTIMDNISFHRPDTTFSEIVKASQLSGAYKFIMELEASFNTIIDEHGSNLSGGEKQKIALARALIGNPKIVIFDEATSNLDVYSEKEFTTTISRLKESQITSIIIAHRITTVRDCDIIHVMENGKIVQSGNHNYLIEKSDYYRNYWLDDSNHPSNIF